MLLVWGFVLSFAGLIGAGCFEAYKIVSVLPAAFESSPALLRSPMRAWEEEYRPNPPGRRRMTPQQRAQDDEQAQQ
jgi:hypothetical protein